MFGLGPGELVTALILVAFVLGLINVAFVIALKPVTSRLDRIIAMLEARNHPPGA